MSKVDDVLWGIEDDYSPGEKDFVDDRIAQVKKELLAILLAELPKKRKYVELPDNVTEDREYIDGWNAAHSEVESKLKGLF